MEKGGGGRDDTMEMTRPNHQTYLFKSSPLAFLNNGFFKFGDNGLCASSMAAEFGVGNADGIDVAELLIICCVFCPSSLITWSGIKKNVSRSTQRDGSDLFVKHTVNSQATQTPLQRCTSQLGGCWCQHKFMCVISSSFIIFTIFWNGMIIIVARILG